MKISELINIIERLHRLFLEFLKAELLRIGALDINSVQSMILYNIGREKMTVGDLERHGFYHGANVTYNLRKMIENSYILQETNPVDLRSSHIKLSEKGVKLYEKLDKLFKIHEKELKEEGIDSPKIVRMQEILTHVKKLKHLLNL